MAAEADVARIARAMAEEHKAGHSTHVLSNGETARLTVGGYCARHVRLCHEEALGLGPFDWHYSAATAREMERKLVADGRGTSAPQPGDVCALNGGSNAAGHIAVYLGRDPQGTQWISENTISAGRNAAYLGRPGVGTCITPLSVVAARLTGMYRGIRELSAAPTQDVKIILQRGDDWRLIPCDALFDGDTVTADGPMLADGLKVPRFGIGRVALRLVAETAGFNVTWHSEQMKVYLSPR